jgi:hypothetical protein
MLKKDVLKDYTTAKKVLRDMEVGDAVMVHDTYGGKPIAETDLPTLSPGAEGGWFEMDVPETDWYSVALITNKDKSWKKNLNQLLKTAQDEINGESV